jgi:formylglycine-generating enzyme required for sulfatase activity
VTQAQYQALTGANPSYFKGRNLPVESVSWNDAMEFCRRLTEREQNAGKLEQELEYTLPAEAQWEYACRARTMGTTHGLLNNDDFNIGKHLCVGSQKGALMLANYNALWTHPGGKHLAQTTTVGSFPANNWGFFDMHGNVCEWCRDWYAEYSDDPGNFGGPENGKKRVARGGSWEDFEENCRSAKRFRHTPAYHSNTLGFRIALCEK